MQSSSNLPSSTIVPSEDSPEYRLIKFLTLAVVLAGMFIATVGLMIVGELRSLSSSREAGFVEIKQELTEIKNNHSREVAEWTIWRNEVDQRLRELTKESEAKK